MQQLIGVPAGQFQANPPIMAPLDYNKIKDFLRRSVSDPALEVEACATLQGLSWRITKVKRTIRRQNLHSYQHYDILELTPKGSKDTIFN